MIADEPGLADCAKVDKSHGERNAHRLFNRWGLALKVPITYMEVMASDSDGDSISVPYLRVPDFAKLLAQKYPAVLLGGLDACEGAQLLKTFWSRYQKCHPQHEVFQQYSCEEWGTLIPMYVHGDKGRTLQGHAGSV